MISLDFQKVWITHVIVLQSMAQLKMMKENHGVLIEKINTILSNTIPLWRNQAAVAFGIDKYEDSNLVQKKVIAATEKITRENDRDIKKHLRKLKASMPKEVDIERVKKLNVRLEDSLYELKTIEQNIRGNSEKMGEILWKANELNSPIKLTL